MADQTYNISGAGDLAGAGDVKGIPLTVEQLMDDAIADSPSGTNTEDLPPEPTPTATGEPPLTPYDNVTEDPLQTPNNENPSKTPDNNVTEDLLRKEIQNLKLDESNNNKELVTDSDNNNQKLSQSASENSLSDKEFTRETNDSGDNGDKSHEKESDMYDFTHKARGTALIFSFSEFDQETQQTEREGAIEETKKLQVLMECLGFNAKLHPNVTREEMTKILTDAAADDHNDDDCFVCILSSHGTQFGWYKEKHVIERNDIVFTKDGYVLLEDVMTHFRDDKCPSLKGKPKLFFIQACRGNKVSHKVETIEGPVHQAEPAPPVGEVIQPPDDEGDIMDEPEGKMKDWKPKPYVCFNYPCYKDYLVSCSTLPGYFSFRNTERSWYFRKLFDELITNCNDLEITEIMELINFRIAYSYQANTLASKNPSDWALDGKGQMPWVMSMLTKQVYLKPKTQEGKDKIKTLKWSMKT